MIYKSRCILLSLFLIIILSACSKTGLTPQTVTSKSDPVKTAHPTSTPGQQIEATSNLNLEDVGISLAYPSLWVEEPSPRGFLRYGKDRGFFSLVPLTSGGLSLDALAQVEAGLEDRHFGSDPKVDSIQVAGAEAFKIEPSVDQPDGQAGEGAWGEILIKLPRPVLADGSLVDIFVLQADLSHLDQIASSVVFDPKMVAESLYPASSDSPAAGICGQEDGGIVQINISPEIMPSPRCMQLRGEQLLSIMNQTDEEIQVKLAWYQFMLQPGENLPLNVPLSAYLAPGVHDLLIEGTGSAPELWVLPPK